MSFAAVAWAVSLRGLDPYKKCILIALADRQNSQTKRCDPSIETISGDTGIAPRTIMQALKALEALGLMEVRRRARRSSQYDLRTDVTMHPGEPKPSIHRRPNFPDLLTILEGEDEETSPDLSARDAPEIEVGAEYAPIHQAPALDASDGQIDVVKQHSNHGMNNGNDALNAREPDQSAQVSNPKTKPLRGCRLPDGWVPSEQWLQFAVDLGLDAQNTLDDFRDYWRSRAGKDGVKLDWEATWRNRCRFLSQNARKQAPRPTKFRGGQADLADEYEEAMRHLGRER